MRLRLAVSAAALSLLALLGAGQARAAAEVHRLNLVLAGIPTQVDGGDMNDYIDFYNKTRLELPPRGYEGLPRIGFTWAFDAEARYFVRPNFALAVGLGQVRAGQRKEYLPAIAEGITVHAEVLTVPIHVGGAYYLQPYNQGDFQARFYVGAGLIQYAYTRATFQQVLTGAENDSVLRAAFAPGTFKAVLTQDAPGYYLESGAHMFFASSLSMMIGVVYRNGVLRNALLETYEVNGTTQTGSTPGPVQSNSKGGPFKLDVSGIGLKMAVGIGF